MEAMLGYTKDQILLFYDNAAKLNARRRAQFISDVRSAVWAEGKDLKKVLELLSNIEKGGDHGGDTK